MTKLLDSFLKFAATKLDESHAIWIEDLRLEARHIPQGFQRQRFLWSGTKSAFAEILRKSVGPKRMGQILLNVALVLFCFVCLVVTMNLADAAMKATFSILLIIYGIMTGLSIFRLKMMKRAAQVFGFGFFFLWVLFGTSILPLTGLNIEFLRAASIEAAAIMMPLYIAGSYLDWVEVADAA